MMRTVPGPGRKGVRDNSPNPFLHRLHRTIKQAANKWLPTIVSSTSCGDNPGSGSNGRARARRGRGPRRPCNGAWRAALTVLHGGEAKAPTSRPDKAKRQRSTQSDFGERKSALGHYWSAPPRLLGRVALTRTHEAREANARSRGLLKQALRLGSCQLLDPHVQTAEARSNHLLKLLS